MNPNEIKKALECCIKGKTRGDCEKLRCPAYRKEGCAYFLKSDSLYDEDAVHRKMCKDALAYINQLEDEVERLKALKYDRAQYNEGYKVGYSSGMEVFAEALESICWYNSHGPFLMNLAERIESEKDETFLYPEDIKWDTEEHFFWMILVSIFGDYGTSIRCGWIEKKEDCAAFIKRICRLYLSTEEDEV